MSRPSAGPVVPVVAEVAEVAEMVARRSYGKLLAYLSARTRDVAAAEDALAEAFAKALESWPVAGIPDRPEGWLLVVARRRLIDAGRRSRDGERALEELTWLAQHDFAAPEETTIPDDRLALMFVCAHPAIDASVRAPLILQTILGLDAATIASAFLVSPAAMGQRLVRAKNKIRHAGIAFRVPGPLEWAPRLDAVLEAIYASFTEGWSDPALTSGGPSNLSVEGIWLGRLMVLLLPMEPEVLGLLSLMLYAHARRATRRSSEGEYIPLGAQNCAEWDHAMIEEAEALLFRAGSMKSPGRYQLEAAVQSVHVARRRSGTTDWRAIELLYQGLSVLSDSPVIAINRAVAIGLARDPHAGLAELDRVADDPRLTDYQPYWAARAELLCQTGDMEGARSALSRAIGLEPDPAVRRFLLKRRATLQ